MMKKRTLLSLMIGLMVLLSNSYAQTSSKSDTAPLNKLDIIGSDLISKDAEYKLVFFGYAGCYHFCDPRLRQIDPIYKELKKHLDIKMLFIDISEETAQDAAERFAKDVNPDFESISPDTTSIKQLQKQFQDVFIRKMPDGEYLHSGFLYLLKKHDKKYYLLKIYPEFDNSEAVIADIRRLTGR